MTMEDTHSHAETEATPEPEGPPQLPTSANNIWQDDASLSSLPPMPSPLEYSASTPLGGVLLMSSSDDRSLFSDKSLEDRLHRTLNHNVASSENQHSSLDLEPTLEVARLVQQVAMLRETNQELRHENKLLITGGQSLEAQKEHLMEAKMTAELREREAQQETASLQQKLQEAHEQVAEKDHEILELKARLEKQSAEQEKQESLQRSALEQAKEEANRKLDSLRRKNASLEQEKEDMAKVLEETQTLLEKATEECAARKVSMDTSTQNDSPPAQETKSVEKDAERPTKMAGRMNVDELEALVSDTLNRNTSPRASDSLPISERLCRIRDATERASLVKEHQREISRLMAAHEADKKQLLQKFEREKEISLENVMAEKDLEFKGLRRRMQSEHAKETEQAEQVHREEMQRVSIIIRFIVGVSCISDALACSH
jgi:hypothetical protein